MKNKKLFNSFKFAFHGVVQAVQKETNVKIHLTALIIVLILSYILKISQVEFILVLIISAIVISAELFNTAIETTVDLIVDDKYTKLAKVAKDVSAGAVLIAAFSAVIIGYIVFYERLDTLMKYKHQIFSVMPTLTMEALLILVFLTIVFFRISSFKVLIMDLGSFISTVIGTIIIFVVPNTLISILSVIITYLFIQSRYEGNIKSLLKLLLGTIIGFIFCLIIIQLFIFGG